MRARARPPVLGLDAGGSGTRIRVEDRPGRVVLERVGPGLDRRDVGPDMLDGTLGPLLDGCPRPAVAVAGVAGRALLRDAVGAWLERWSGAPVTTVPDYVVALRSFSPCVETAVVAGTGSVVVSHDRAGNVVTTGGLGHLVGDEGSAFRLGQRLAVRYLEGVPAAARFGGAIRVVLGAEDLERVRTQRSDQPAAVLGRVAPVLTAAADAGDEWARALVIQEMEPLAALTARHVERFAAAPGTSPITIGVIGGVWHSAFTREAFSVAIEALLADRVSVVPAQQPAVVGALHLAWDAR